MKGLEISRLFSSEWLLPFIDRELPDLRSHIAVGRFMGSDAIPGGAVVSYPVDLWSAERATAKGYRGTGRHRQSPQNPLVLHVQGGDP